MMMIAVGDDRRKGDDANYQGAERRVRTVYRNTPAPSVSPGVHWLMQWSSPPTIIAIIAFIGTMTIAYYRLGMVEQEQRDMRVTLLAELRQDRKEAAETYQRRDVTEGKLEQVDLKLEQIRQDIADLRRTLRTKD